MWVSGQNSGLFIIILKHLQMLNIIRKSIYHSNVKFGNIVQKSNRHIIAYIWGWNDQWWKLENHCTNYKYSMYLSTYCTYKHWFKYVLHLYGQYAKSLMVYMDKYHGIYRFWNLIFSLICLVEPVISHQNRN